MKILGVHSLTHNLGAALCIDGKIRAAVEEERFSKIKHHPGIEVEGREPWQSVEWVLSDSGISPDDIDLFVHVGWPGNDFARLDIIRRRFREFARSLDPKDDRTLYVDHHRAHAASAFYASGYPEALVAAIDGQGDWISTSLYVGQGRELKKVDEYFVDQSLGFMYSRAAKLLGLGGFGFGEGKMVALSGYGNCLLDFPSPILLEGDRYRVVEGHFEKTFKQYQFTDGKLTQAHKDFAATIQTCLESTVASVLSAVAARYNQSKLALAGGVALNCKMNGRLARLPWVDSMYVQPAANDCGLCIGAAYLGALSVGDTPKEMDSIFLGPELGNPEPILKRNNLSAQFVDNPAEAAAEALAQHRTVAWMQGKLELGPRALGHRSLLGDPRSIRCRNQLNAIKEREQWRPLAPAICADGKEYCDLREGTKYMTHAIEMSPLAREKIPGAVHVDGTARVQIVDSGQSEFYSLLKGFDACTGVSAVLNTSLNRRGEPLCCSIEDGIRFFFTTPTDTLIMGNWAISK